MVIMMIFNMSTSYFHTKMFHYLWGLFMMKLTLGSGLPQLIVTTLGAWNQAIPPIEELPIPGPNC